RDRIAARWRCVMTVVGMPVNRVDGPDKVTGAARYTAEIAVPGLAYAALVGATESSARVTAIDTAEAMKQPGVLAVMTHREVPKIAAPPHLLPSLLGQAAPGESFFPMQDEVVHYSGQPVAIVIADQH